MQDMAIVSEMLKYNTAVTSVDLARNDLNQGGYAIAEWMQNAHQLERLNLSEVRFVLHVYVNEIVLCLCRPTGRSAEVTRSLVLIGGIVDASMILIARSHLV
jgi:hypothetical protein